jgi:hypothetical protein
MLDAAVRLVVRAVENPPADSLASAVAHIRVTEVVAEATSLAVEHLGADRHAYQPFSIGALYQIWPTQPDFQRELLLHLAQLGAEVVPAIDTTSEQIAGGLTGEELLHTTLRLAWEDTRSDPIFRALLAAYPHIANEEIRSAMAYQHTTFLERVSQAWRQTLSASGRAMRHPYTVEHVARSVLAVINGFVLQWLASEEGFADPLGDPDWDLATRGIDALIQAYTTPALEATT